MTLLDLSLPLGLGVASSLHCAQMCGPLVLSYSIGSGGGPKAHICYNLGRVATYTVLGAVAGAVGSMVGMVGRLAGVEQGAALAAGILMILAAVLTAGFWPKTGLIQLGAGVSGNPVTRVAGRLLTSRSAWSKLALGAVLGFLPCGLVYAALLKAMAADGAAGGAVTMALFGLGTSGSLLAIGLFSSVIGRRLGRYSNQIAAASMLVMGAILIWHGLKTVTTGAQCHLH